ncbi:MAG: replication-associated recombination protein A [Candidatus Spechtbacteria bacterium SB0662_bin_43]|uniref:Replication-associated recombination protein A n=1 Tax=Candidatus Spechtbacteria bacterium SB0662_bin_43 TaxID=2604897 RepID=A0A845D997_9BACT|nr:replication-associated recombination protein A [Candidatus Spechtbacteria bacterium SB0662_bin_43]
MNTPLASLLRPQSLGEFVGQEHLVGENKPLRVAMEKHHLFSFILWGPPGVGKTTLARLYASSFDAELYELSAVSCGKNDIRALLTKNQSQQPILFLDEIHRFNKSQQDFLLPNVENGSLILIGATTENPSFEVIPPLLSRCRVFVLESLHPDHMHVLIERTGYSISDDAKDMLISYADGDARLLLTILENARSLYETITVDTLKDTIQSKHLRYDKKGEEHYNTISAFIKSMRASQPNAALYYLARMIESGEDPRFIARRMVIFASEDIGVAHPTALVVANEVFRAVETIGLPECVINLGHGAVYLSQCNKDRRAYDGIMEALKDAKQFGALPIPLMIRNAPTQLMKDLEYGKGYEMYTKNDLRPKKLHKKTYFKTKESQ